jgi:hypothetical protein
MKCPHCGVGIAENFTRGANVQHQNARYKGRNFPALLWVLLGQQCPECRESIIFLEPATLLQPNQPAQADARLLVYPQNKSMRQVPAEVTDPYKQDFIEACNVLPISPKASAALSRRTLQAILRDKADTKNKDLFDQIDEVVNSGKLPSHIQEGLHAVRDIGNFGAHEIKSKVTGAIVDVETGEAEWNLDVLESLFDFYFVQPAIAAKRKAELNKKLREAGKPEIP